MDSGLKEEEWVLRGAASRPAKGESVGDGQGCVDCSLRSVAAGPCLVRVVGVARQGGGPGPLSRACAHTRTRRRPGKSEAGVEERVPVSGTPPGATARAFARRPGAFGGAADSPTPVTDRGAALPEA